MRFRRASNTAVQSAEWRCRVTTLGAIQSALATVWTFFLTISFVAALGGLSGVESCMKRVTPPPPRPPPPPPPPPPSPTTCSLTCRRFYANRHCDQACNIPACKYDGGDCSPRAPVTQPRTPITNLNDLFRNFGGPTMRTIGRRLRQDTYDSYSYDGDDDDDDYSYSYDDDDDDDEPLADVTTYRTPKGKPPLHHSSRDDDDDDDDDELEWMENERPSFTRHVTAEVVTPMLGLVGSFGGLGALCALIAGLLAVCGAASSSATVLRASAVLSGIGALGGILLTVGSGVVGIMLTSGVGIFLDVLEREFENRAALCAGKIQHYAYYVGWSLIGLAFSAGIGAVSSLCGIDATCKLANACADNANAEGEGEQLSLFAQTQARRRGFSSGGGSLRSAVEDTDVEMTTPQPVIGLRMSNLESGLAMSAPSSAAPPPPPPTTTTATEPPPEPPTVPRPSLETPPVPNAGARL